MIRNGHAGFGRGVSEKDHKAPRRGPTSADPIGDKARADFGRVGFGERPVVLLIDISYSFCGEESLPILEAIELYHNSCGDRAWPARHRPVSIRRWQPRTRASDDNPTSQCQEVTCGSTRLSHAPLRRRQTSMCFASADCMIIPCPGHGALRRCCCRSGRRRRGAPEPRSRVLPPGRAGPCHRASARWRQRTRHAHVAPIRMQPSLHAWQHAPRRDLESLARSGSAAEMPHLSRT